MAFHHNVATLTLKPFKKHLDSSSVIHYTVFPDMKVVRNKYTNGFHVESMIVGEYIYFESHDTYIYVNYEGKRRHPSYDEEEPEEEIDLPTMPSFRAHTPFTGPWPEKCREDYLFNYKDLIANKLNAFIAKRKCC